MKHALFLSAVVLVAASCGPNPPAPVSVMAVVPTVTGQYSTKQVQLRTVTSITALKGSVASLVGGARIVIDSTDPLQADIGTQTDEQRYQNVVKDKGLDVRANYIERAGVLWPADFDSWNMVTTYYNFEQAYGYFQAINDSKDLPEIQGMRVFYWPEVHFNSTAALVDNALFFSLIQSFFVVPQQDAQQIPLAMNLGVIGHETGHKVFNHRVLNDEGLHPALVNWTLAPFNLLKSIDEGFADFHGYGTTCTSDVGCQANFLSPSLPATGSTKNRDVSNVSACMTASLKTSFTNSDQATWISSPDEYTLGNIWASAMYQAGMKVNGPASIKVLQASLIKAYDDDTPATPGLSQLVNQNLNNPAAFTPEAVANTIAAHITDKILATAWCDEISDRLQLNTTCPSFPCDALPDCPPESARNTIPTSICPTVP